MNINVENNVVGATRLFEILLKKHKLERHHMANQPPEMILPFFNSWDGLLPIWMIKSDEMAVELLGHRLWDVVYEGNSESILGLSCRDKAESIPSYDQYPVANESEIPFSLRFLLCQQSLVENMRFKGRTFEHKDLTGLYDITEALGDGDVLPFPNADSIMTVRLNSFIMEANRKKILTKELVKEAEVNL